MVPLPSWWQKLDLNKVPISELFEDLPSWNLESKLITPKYITGNYIGAIMAIFNFFSVCFLCVMFFLTPERAPKAGPCHLFSNRNKFILVYIIGTKWRHSILCQKCFKECLFTDSESVHNILFPDSVSVLNILFNELQTWTYCNWNVNVTITT